MRLELPPEEPPPRVPCEEERVRQRIEGYFHDHIAHERARRGNADPGWTYLAQRIETYWEPDFSQVHDSRIAEVSGPWLVDTIWKSLRGWYLDIQRNRKDPFMRPPRVPGDEAAEAWARLVDLQRDAYESSEYGNRVTTLVEIRVGGGGELRARLHASSGHPAFDRAAMQAVERAIGNPIPEELPPGPARSLYALTAHYRILPPLPVVGFSFDILLGHFDLLYPLKKMVSGQARLVAVYRQEVGPQ